MNFPSLRESHGFTLLEILIAVALMAFIGVAVANRLTKSWELQAMLSTETDFYNEIRISADIIDRDVTNMYSPKIMLPDAKSQTETVTTGSTAPAEQETSESGSRFWGKLLDSSGVRHATFSGEEKEISFISTSHIRIYRESPESLFSKITYELKDDPDAKDELQGTKILLRKVSPNAFSFQDDNDTMEKTYPLVRGIKNFNFRYYSKEKDRWEKRWDGNTGEYANRFPDIIELEIETVGKDRHLFRGRFHFRPELPIEGIQPST